MTSSTILNKQHSFSDSWRGKKAICHLIGEGDGPQGEAVRMVGFPGKGGAPGFTLAYIRCYHPGQGHGRVAYAWLNDMYGPVKGIEVVSEAGIGFNRQMIREGLLLSFAYEQEGEPRIETPATVADLDAGAPRL